MDLGKHAGFILTSYGVTALVFAVLIGGALAHARRWRRKAEELSRK
jgi:heme exporter protein CcmD